MDARREACLKAWHSRPEGELHAGFEYFERNFNAAWDAAVQHERSRVVFGLRWFSDWLGDHEADDETCGAIWDFAWWVQNPDFLRGEKG